MKTGNISLKRGLAEYARKMAYDNLVTGSSGNISQRSKSHIYIKRSGASFEEAKPSDFIPIGIDESTHKDSKKRPSCEYRFHLAVYKKRPEIEAVFHTHPLVATTLYSAGMRLKPITLEFALYIEGSLVVIPFMPPGSKKLAEEVKKAAESSDLIIMKKHGLITMGESLQEAYLRAIIVEREARAQVLCRLFNKKPPYLTKKELDSLTSL